MLRPRRFASYFCHVSTLPVPFINTTYHNCYERRVTMGIAYWPLEPSQIAIIEWSRLAGDWRNFLRFMSGGLGGIRTHPPLISRLSSIPSSLAVSCGLRAFSLRDVLVTETPKIRPKRLRPYDTLGQGMCPTKRTTIWSLGVVGNNMVREWKWSDSRGMGVTPI